MKEKKMPIKNPFLKATPLYKEYAILELLSKDSNVTQRAISKELDSSLSMVNQYLEQYENEGFLRREQINGKNMSYKLTRDGIVRLKYLNIRFLESIRELYLIAKENIIVFLHQIRCMGYEKILLYGAGEVALLTLQVLLEDNNHPLNVVALIDDDISKQGSEIMGIKVISKNMIEQYDVDGILISSYNHNLKIRKKLRDLNYPNNKIFDFFMN